MTNVFTNHRFGVMQGRLLPKYKGRYQAHPVGYWQQEFAIARELGLDCIEFIVDINEIAENPLLSPAGLEDVRCIANETGIGVHTICADCFMQSPMHSVSDQQKEASVALMLRLIASARTLGISDIVIPCVDNSSLQKEAAFRSFVEVLKTLKAPAEEAKINLSLETDLAPAKFADLLTQCESPQITVNYDIGNSAALGFDFREELAAYGEKISDLHVKDRTLGGGPVVLGSGNADIPGFFKELQNYDFQGPIIMQAFRDDDGVAIFKEQLQWLQVVLRD